MTKLVIVGQAPSRLGDGRPFSGPSGQRLCRMFSLPNYEALNSRVILQNLLDKTAVKRASGRGDTFDRAAAHLRAQQMIREWARQPELIVTLACGHEVYRSLTGHKKDFFTGSAAKLGPAQFVDIWCFPHPSGASAFWNDPQKSRQAHKFIDRLLTHYGINMA